MIPRVKVRGERGKKWCVRKTYGTREPVEDDEKQLLGVKKRDERGRI